MKYQDRKKAKRKYKQALVTTVAALTLGLSVGGSFTMPTAAHATMADEQPTVGDTGLTQYQLEQLFPGQVAEKKKDAATKVKELAGFVGTSYDQLTADPKFNLSVQAVSSIAPAIFDAIKNDGTIDPAVLNGIAKNLTMAGVQAIPFVGGIASTVIGMFWPNVSGPDQFALLEERMIKLLNDTVTASEQNNLSEDLKQVVRDMRALDGLLKDEAAAKAKTAAGGVARSVAYAASYAKGINGTLNTILGKIEGSQFKANMVPLYTQAATIKLLFLKFAASNKNNPEMFNSDADYNSLQNANESKTARELAIHYRDFVNKTVGTKEVALQAAFIKAQTMQTAAAFNDYYFSTEANVPFNTIVKATIGKESINVPVNVPVTISADGPSGTRYLSSRASDISWIDCDGKNNTSDDQNYTIVPVKADDGIYAIKAKTNNKYVTFEEKGFGLVQNLYNDLEGLVPGFVRSDANADVTWIRLVPLTDAKGNVIENKFVMRSIHSYRESYIYADFNHNGKLKSGSRQIGNWEQFTITKK